MRKVLFGLWFVTTCAVLGGCGGSSRNDEVVLEALPEGETTGATDNPSSYSEYSSGVGQQSGTQSYSESGYPGAR
jgi:hypothetical protein